MKLFLATTLLVVVCGVLQVQGSPAEARIREQFDKEHEEGIDRIRARLHGVQAAESGNRDRQFMAQDSEAEVHITGSKHGRGGKPARDGGEAGDRLVDRGYERDGGSRQVEPEAGSNPEGPDAERSGGGGEGEQGPRVEQQRGRGDQGQGGGKRGRIPDVHSRASDKKVYDRQHEDAARYATQDDIDFAKDSYRKKDKTSHKKEELYTS